MLSGTGAERREKLGRAGRALGQRSEGLGRGGKQAAGRGGKKGSWADGVLGPGWVLAGFPFLILFYSISKANTEILIEFKFQFEFKPSTHTKRTMHQHECNHKIFKLRQILITL